LNHLRIDESNEAHRIGPERLRKKAFEMERSGLTKLEQTMACDVLPICVKLGIQFHSAQLSVLEWNKALCTSRISLLVAASTVTTGVDIPADRQLCLSASTSLSR
jgi:replicative superfamily II helicase